MSSVERRRHSAGGIVTRNWLMSLRRRGARRLRFSRLSLTVFETFHRHCRESESRHQRRARASKGEVVGR